MRDDGMSYLQTYGHPAVLPSPAADPNLCAWPAPGACESQVPGSRCLKRRVTANRKERRRTLSINNAFAELRDRLPNVAADTKLSKIRTLRLAKSYIEFLMNQLAGEEAQNPTTFKAEVISDTEHPTAQHVTDTSKVRKTSGRTGWPQHVWALELKHENPSKSNYRSGGELHM